MALPEQTTTKIKDYIWAWELETETWWYTHIFRHQFPIDATLPLQQKGGQGHKLLFGMFRLTFEPHKNVRRRSTS